MDNKEKYILVSDSQHATGGLGIPLEYIDAIKHIIFVKKIGDYWGEDESKRDVFMHIVNIERDANVLYKAEMEKLKGDSDLHFDWWQEERKKTKKLEEEIDRLKGLLSHDECKEG